MKPKLETTLELVGDREIVVTRAFHGPAHIVFECWTKPELVRRWWAPRSHGVELVGCEVELRAGGGYRYTMRHAGGDMVFSGEYREVTPPSRLVYTEAFQPAPDLPPVGEPTVNTVTFDERAGSTFVTLVTTCASAEVREMILATGMESGMREHLEQLAELVASRL